VAVALPLLVAMVLLALVDLVVVVLLLLFQERRRIMLGVVVVVYFLVLQQLILAGQVAAGQVLGMVFPLLLEHLTQVVVVVVEHSKNQVLIQLLPVQTVVLGS